jgi:hypothetical protein
MPSPTPAGAATPVVVATNTAENAPASKPGRLAAFMAAVTSLAAVIAAAFHRFF